MAIVTPLLVDGMFLAIPFEAGNLDIQSLVAQQAHLELHLIGNPFHDPFERPIMGNLAGEIVKALALKALGGLPAKTLRYQTAPLR